MRTVGAILTAIGWSVAAAAFAHDSFIVPPPSVIVGQPVVVLVTSSSFFPEPETRIRPERIAHVDARADGTPLTWSATADDVAMTLTTSPASAAQTGAVIVVSLAPYDIDVASDEVGHYMDEIGATPAVRAAAETAAASGAMHETYAKHLKTIVCAATCADNAAPGPATFEFVADPTSLRGFTLFLNGSPVPNQPVFVVTEATGRGALMTDGQGRVVLPEGLSGLVYVSAVKLEPPLATGDRFVSQWASLTFDARLLNR
ncbi:MAG: hypothetical protein V4701_08745 [Pseudomonadota bacterium]